MARLEHVRSAGAVAWALVGLAALVSVVGFIAWYLRVIFPPLILAGAIVYLLHPFVGAMQKRGVPRAGGAALAYVFVLGVIVLGGIGVWPLAADQVDDLTDEWPEITARVETFVDDLAADSEGTFLEFSREEIEDSLDSSGGTFEEQLRRVRRIGTEVFHVLLILVLGPIIGFYLLVDLPHLKRVAENLIPDGAQEEVVAIARRLNRAIGGFFRGQLLVAAIVGVLCSIGLGIVQVKFWFLIGMIAGLFNVIPLVGPWVGGVPGVTIALTTGSPLKAIGVVVVMVVVQQIDNHLITPYVMQRAVQLHPAVVILALVAGGSLFGFLGLLLAVPAAAVLKILVSHLWHVHVLGRPIEHDLDDVGPGPVEEVDERPENQGDAATPSGDEPAGAGTPRP